MSELRLKRHETFSIRSGWLEKGINKIAENPYCFRKEEGPRIFGLGSNMVKSLRYWLSASGLAIFSVQKGAELTELGKFLLDVDPFLESDFSWWLIHYNLATNPNGDTPVISAFFNMEYSKIEKGHLFNLLKDKFEQEYGSVGAESSLDSDISILFKSYYSDDSSNPEDNLNCPLGRLKLVTSIDKKTFIKETPSYNRLSYKVVYYSLINCIEANANNCKSVNFEDLFDMPNNPIKVFNLTKTMLIAYLEEMQRNGLISLVKTAGLNVITVEKTENLRDIYDL